MNIGDRITLLREKRGISRKELAASANVPYENLAKYEQNAAKPSIDAAEKIANYFKTSLDYIYTGNKFPLGATPAKQVPVLGSIAAGVPIAAQQNIIDWVFVPLEYADGKHFALIVRGDSMEPKIPNGSMIIVRQDYDYHENKTCVYLVNGEVTVKRAKRTNGSITLIANNPMHPPQFYNAGEVLMQGVVVKVMSDPD